MINNHKIFIIVAVDEENGIGKNGTLPWKLKKEMKYFADTTKKTKDPSKQNMVIMGSRTWESLPESFRPLPERKNVVLTRAGTSFNGASTSESFDAAFALADDSVENIFVLGGENVFKQSIEDPRLDGVFVTRVYKKFNCDKFFPEIPKEFSTKISLGKEHENNIDFEFLLFKRN